MAATECRWGFLGTAGIARKNWQAVRHAGNARLVAVASREHAKAAAFVDGCQAQVPHPVPPEPLGSYEELLARPDVDAIYLPLPTGIRSEWAVRAARAGKHVLVEKPCGIDVADLERILAACRDSGVQFMDGVMYLHSRRLEAVRGVLGTPDGVGTIRRIATQFSFRAPPEFFAGNIRVQSGLEPLGCLGDLGWYTIGAILWVMEGRRPTAVTGRLVRSEPAAGSGHPVPLEFAGEILFGDEPDVTASFFCSFLVEHQQWLHVSGTHGSLRIDDFVLPFFGAEVEATLSRSSFSIDGCEFRMERHDRRIAVAEYANGHPNAQETNLFRDFSALAVGGRPDPVWPARSLATQRVLMACLASALHDGRSTPLA